MISSRSNLGSSVFLLSFKMWPINWAIRSSGGSSGLFGVDPGTTGTHKRHLNSKMPPD
jgi:hypothetical protein